MGAYYSIVNPSKRQYLCIAGFGEHFKLSGLLTGWNGESLHSIGVAWLVCRVENDRQFGRVGGTWFGDPSILQTTRCRRISTAFRPPPRSILSKICMRWRGESLKT